MTAATNKEKLGFQSEAKQLLHLMIHSLYSNKEIFLRELISNASDALDRLRFEALSNSSLMESGGELRITISTNPKKKTLTVSDNGIGMTREEIIANLGTIAKSGTGQFMASLTGDQKKDALLIGQFGVGFYSSFIVADKVEVTSRKAGVQASEGVRWVSTGESDFEVEDLELPERGTTVTLHLRKGEQEFADDWRLRNIIKKYADHISFPVMMQKTPAEEDEQHKKDKKAAEYEAVNAAEALWTRPRKEVKEEEYREFYKHISHDFQDPLEWSHNRVEGKLDYTSLLYIPAKAPFDLYQREAARGLKLYVQRVFIMDEVEQFLPLYLRFVKGVVDSNDLSLNVSRELLQKDPAIEKIRSALTKRVLDMCEKMAKKGGETYQNFWNELGQVLKEGPAEDFANRERIAALLRFSTTHTDNAVQDQSLADYVARMKEGQEKIFYVCADSFTTAKNSPHLELCRKEGIEVLLLYDRIDEWLMSHLMEYEGKQFQDLARESLDLGKLQDEKEKEKREERSKEFASLVERIKSAMGERVQDVRVTHRLTDSPACLVVGDYDLGIQMRRILEASGQQVPAAKRIFEINPDHPLIRRLDDEADEARFADLSLILFEQASLAEGGQLEDPPGYVRRMNALLLELAAVSGKPTETLEGEIDKE